jgi:hypothetical protein
VSSHWEFGVQAQSSRQPNRVTAQILFPGRREP